MKQVWCLISMMMLAAVVTAQSDVKRAPRGAVITTAVKSDETLASLVKQATNAAFEKFKDKNLKPDELAVTVIELTNGARRQASYRGTEAIYPASVVKMFYMVAAHAQMQDGTLRDSPELQRAMRDMIVDSSNDATHYMVDALSGVTGGVELPERELKAWMNKRQTVNRYFAALGFDNINVAQKTWCEAPYGRESQFVKDAAQSRVKGAKNNRNSLTTEATARLLADIAEGQAVSKERAAQMMLLMKRDFTGATQDPDDQAHGFTGLALTAEKYKAVKLWSKAGWTSTTRHDAAYLELPNGRRLVLVIFTERHSNERLIIPTVASVILEAMMKS